MRAQRYFEWKKKKKSDACELAFIATAAVVHICVYVDSSLVLAAAGVAFIPPDFCKPRKVETRGFESWKATCKKMQDSRSSGSVDDDDKCTH